MTDRHWPLGSRKSGVTICRILNSHRIFRQNKPEIGLEIITNMAAVLRNRKKKRERSTKFNANVVFSAVKENIPPIIIRWKIYFLISLLFVALCIFLYNEDLFEIKSVLERVLKQQHHHQQTTTTTTTTTSTRKNRVRETKNSSEIQSSKVVDQKTNNPVAEHDNPGRYLRYFHGHTASNGIKQSKQKQSFLINFKMQCYFFLRLINAMRINSIFNIYFDFREKL